MTIPTLDAEQYQYLDDGVLLNDDPSLPFVDILSVDGVDSAPVRQSTTPREGLHGGWVDAEYEDIRTISIEGEMYASVTELETFLDSMKANFAPTRFTQPFYMGTDAGTRLVLAKSLGLRYVKDSGRRIGRIPFQVQLLQEDPRLYDAVELTQSIPGTFALSGNRETTGKIKINGSRTNPSITLDGSTLAFEYTITSGHYIEIDLDKRTVLYDGVTNVRAYMTIAGGWPVMGPGDNVFTVGGTGAGAIVATARSAWR